MWDPDVFFRVWSRYHPPSRRESSCDVVFTRIDVCLHDPQVTIVWRPTGLMRREGSRVSSSDISIRPISNVFLWIVLVPSNFRSGPKRTSRYTGPSPDLRRKGLNEFSCHSWDSHVRVSPETYTGKPVVGTYDERGNSPWSRPRPLSLNMVTWSDRKGREPQRLPVGEGRSEEGRPRFDVTRGLMFHVTIPPKLGRSPDRVLDPDVQL